jgi:hypothetical protein
MGPYDHRRVTLDPGLTALALRALAERDGHYPFLQRFRRRARRTASATPASRRAARASATARSEADRAPFWPRSLRAAELFPTLSRLRAMRGPSSAAA